MNKDLYYQMLRIRMIEMEIAKRYPEGKMRCPVHLSVGQEAPAVGVCAGLDKDDRMVSTHRGHAHYLAKGGSLIGLLGELYGKSIGCSRGNGGSMHLIDLGVNFECSTSIVGGTVPVGVGLSFADKLKGDPRYTVICIGDAAVEEGVFHEAANFCGLHRLHVIFALEDNQYSCYTHQRDRQPIRHLRRLATAHEMYRDQVSEDSKNYPEAIKNSVEHLKTKKGPSLLIIPTWRHLQHCGPDNDDNLGYRDPNEIEYFLDNDPIAQQNSLIMAMFADEIQKEIDEAFAVVEAAPYPDPSEIGKYVYKTT